MLIKKINIEDNVVYIIVGKNSYNHIFQIFSLTSSEIKYLNMKIMKQYIKNSKKFSINMFIKQILIYFLTIDAVKTQRKSRMKDENPKIKVEKQSKKKPQITAKTATFSFFRNSEQEIAKGKIKTGFAFEKSVKISLDCKTKKKKTKHINNTHCLIAKNFFSFKAKTPLVYFIFFITTTSLTHVTFSKGSTIAMQDIPFFP